MNFLDDLRLQILCEELSPADALHMIFEARRDNRITPEEALSLYRERSPISRAYRENLEGERRRNRLDVRIGEIIHPPVRSISNTYAGGGEAANTAYGKSAVYFVEAPILALIKIGVTTQLNTRLQQLASMSPVPLVFLGASVGELEYERKIHKHFDHVRSHGEWFHDTPEIRDAIKCVLAHYPHATVIDQVSRAA